MIDILRNLWGMAEVAFQYFTNLISSLVDFIAVLALSVTVPQSLPNFVVGILGSSVLVTIAIYVIKTIIGR